MHDISIGRVISLRRKGICDPSVSDASYTSMAQGLDSYFPFSVFLFSFFFFFLFFSFLTHDLTIAHSRPRWGGNREYRPTRVVGEWGWTDRQMHLHRSSLVTPVSRKRKEKKRPFVIAPDVQCSIARSIS